MAICRLQGFEEKQKGIYYEYDSGISPLGEGAMGRVYKGYRVEENTGSRVPVAIKAIYENIPDRVIERARREASVRIDSPFLLKMYGFIEMPTSSVINGQTIRITRYFVVMELLTGVTLYDLIQGVTCDGDGHTIQEIKKIHDEYVVNKYPTIQDLMSKVLCGVYALHAANYIHRDIDPSNIMITADGQVKLIDFGICKPIKTLGTVDSNLTATGVFMGKVNYAAPELVIGDVAHQNPSTDIYALGILLFQMCTGKLPFSGDDNDVLLCQMRKPLPLREIEQRSLRKIVNRATQKSQSQRYTSAGEMLEDLEKIDFSDNATNWYNYMAYILVALGLVVCAIYFISRSVEDSADDYLDTETVKEETVDAEDIQFNHILKRMWSKDDKEVNQAFRELAKMAQDTHHKDAMFEYGLTFSVGNDYFDIPTRRQKRLKIGYDTERANLWLRRALEKDETSYRAVYWILNNLIAKKEKDRSSVLTEEINDVLEKFDRLIANQDDAVAKKYRNAVSALRKKLIEWEME